MLWEREVGGICRVGLLGFGLLCYIVMVRINLVRLD